jgi:tetratricopeptide (TPR) repeat protein
MFQALFFNLVFRSFFFFLALFLIKLLSERRPKFHSLSIHHKFVVTFLFLAIYTTLYILPFMSDTMMKRSEKSTNIVKATSLLKTAQLLNPLDHAPYYRQASIFLNLFKQTSNLEAFSHAMDNTKKVHRLNPHHLESHLLEAELFSTFLSKNLKYPNLKEEILTPIESAQKISPFNPFIRLTKAKILMEFGELEAAKVEALAALEIEPEFVRALYFLHRHFNFLPDPPEFERHIEEITAKAAQWQLQPGTYLFELFSLPDAGPIQH